MVSNVKNIFLIPNLNLSFFYGKEKTIKPEGHTQFGRNAY
jgi:hypothetical protein